MSELGRLLSEARTAKGLTLAEVETATRIRQKYLEALETGSYAELPRGAVSRGFLRTYARHLGLDSEHALQLYAAESGDAGEQALTSDASQPRPFDYRPLEVDLSVPAGTKGRGAWLPLAIILVVLVAAGIYVGSLYPGLVPLERWLPIASATPTQTATRWVVTATPTRGEAAAGALPTPTSDLLPLPTPTVPPTITPTPRPTATPEVVASIAMELRTDQRAWIRAIVDGEVVEEGAIEAGQVRSWQAEQSVAILTGNAGGVFLTLNGEDLGAMGDVGQVVERTWVVEQGDVTETGAAAVTPTTTVTSTPAG